MDGQESLRAVFEHLHAHPEVSGKEYETTEYLRKALLGAGIEAPPVALETGLVGVIRGGEPGGTLVLRADIDALPITEETGLPYASRNPGVMHACGHDVHMSVVLGAAWLLAARRRELRGTVKILFQPAEEDMTGARRVLRSGAVADADAMLSLHCNPAMEAGVWGLRAGSVTASVDRLAITVTGAGGHAAMPQLARDPIVCASALVAALQTVVSRSVSPLDEAVVSVTSFHSGSSWNIIPDSAALEGTVRALGDARPIRKRVEELAQGIAGAYGARVDVAWEAGPPATANDAALVEAARAYAARNGYRIAEGMRTMVGEDFALYQERCPGALMWLGVGAGEPLHSPRFRADPSVVEPAARFLAGLVVGQMGALAREGRVR